MSEMSALIEKKVATLGLHCKRALPQRKGAPAGLLGVGAVCELVVLEAPHEHHSQRGVQMTACLRHQKWQAHTWNCA
jgi:hypothetical protein